jgi:branched-chain amino acid transport system substrate-binding protein
MNKDPVRIGLLFSETGVTSELESSQLYGALFAIQEINARGGLEGRELVGVRYDPHSDNTSYKRLIERLITEDKVNVIFGGYMSSSRKAMLPIVEKYNKLLFYPEQYEGFEFSNNVVYTGAAPNQNIVQLADYMVSRFGHRIYMVGSRYNYPYETNRTMQSLISNFPGNAIVGERYVSLYANPAALEEIVRDIMEKRPDFIFCTLIGRSVSYLYQAFRSFGLDPNTMPIGSLNTSEAEIAMMGADAAYGHFTSSPYFQSIDSPTNRSTLLRFFESPYGALAIPNMNWEASYFGMKLFAKAFEKAGSDDIQALLPCLLGSEIDAPQGRVRINPSNHHASLYPRIGQADSRGQFAIIKDAVGRIEPDPYMVHHKWDKQGSNALEKETT